jgi:hypothetical protein
VRTAGEAPARLFGLTRRRLRVERAAHEESGHGAVAGVRKDGASIGTPRRSSCFRAATARRTVERSHHAAFMTSSDAESRSHRR